MPILEVYDNNGRLLISVSVTANLSFKYSVLIFLISRAGKGNKVRRRRLGANEVLLKSNCVAKWTEIHSTSLDKCPSLWVHSKVMTY